MLRYGTEQYILVFPRFADLSPISAIVFQILIIDFAYLEIDFLFCHNFGSSWPTAKYDHTDPTEKCILNRFKPSDEMIFHP